MARTAAAERANLIREYPKAELAQCGNCGRTFPDVFPAARCPFEYYNSHQSWGRTHNL